jgi:integrase
VIEYALFNVEYFNHIDKKLRKACRDIKYEKTVTLRDLRAWCATVGDWKTGDRKATMEVLGHQNPQITERYLSAHLDRMATHLAAVEEHLFAKEVEGAIAGGYRSDTQPISHAVTA